MAICLNMITNSSPPTYCADWKHGRNNCILAVIASDHGMIAISSDWWVIANVGLISKCLSSQKAQEFGMFGDHVEANRVHYAHTVKYAEIYVRSADSKS